mgnify:FL=1
MDDLERIIKEEFDNMKLPNDNMADHVSKRISSVHRHKHTPVAICAAAVLCVFVLCSTVTIYAEVNGLSIVQLLESIWDKPAAKSIYESISCDASVINEDNSFSEIDVTPVRIVGDVRGIYIIFKVTDNSDIVSPNDSIGFKDYGMDFSGGQDASVAMYVLDSQDNTEYIALEYIGGTEDGLVSDSGTIDVELKDYKEYKGCYTAKISYSYSHEEISFTHDSYTVYASALTLVCEVDDNDKYYNIMDSDICVIMNDNTRTSVEFCYGVEEDDTYRIIYRLMTPVNPYEIKDVIVDSGHD